MQIGKDRKNEIALAINESTFSPAEFETGESPAAIAVRHKPTGAGLVVNYGEPHGFKASFYVSWSVGDEPEQGIPTEYLMPAVSSWLEDIKKDLETPDLWAQIGKEPMADLAEGQENTPFSEAEREQIAQILEEVKREAQEHYGLGTEELGRLEAKLDALRGAAERVGRKDWLIIAYGVIIGKFVDAALDPHIAEKVLTALGAGLVGVFGHPLPLLGP